MIEGDNRFAFVPMAEQGPRKIHRIRLDLVLPGQPEGQSLATPEFSSDPMACCRTPLTARTGEHTWGEGDNPRLEFTVPNINVWRCECGNCQRVPGIVGSSIIRVATTFRDFVRFAPVEDLDAIRSILPKDDVAKVLEYMEARAHPDRLSRMQWEPAFRKSRELFYEKYRSRVGEMKQFLEQENM